MTRDAGPGAEVPDTKIGEDIGALNHQRSHKGSWKSKKGRKGKGSGKSKGGTLGVEATYDHSGRSVQDPTRKMPQVRSAKLQTHEHGMLSAILVQDRFASHPYQCGTMVVD